MITKSASGIWEISIPAPLPCSASEQLIGYARYKESRIEVWASHLLAHTDVGLTIVPISDDPAIRAAMARALLWRLMSDVVVAVEAPGIGVVDMDLIDVPKKGRKAPIPVRLDTGSFDTAEAPDYDVFDPQGGE